MVARDTVPEDGVILDEQVGRMSDRFMPDVNAGADELELDYDEGSDEWEDGEVRIGNQEWQPVAKGNGSGGAIFSAVGVFHKSSVDSRGASRQRKEARKGNR
ncbi:hypothetical protein NDU88_007419 [Pleurodeles waltl]|uniref:Uncharacterized protein n=1 Tax=Pleurodeles waltl TaxID=8319 RepID=A0AAV7PRC8_PLEWA|nr:hypothetical protein NDU88_007419 [Pleurodeles waltl]